MEANETLILNDEARRRLYRVYKYLLSLNRRKKAASQEGLDGDTRPVVSGTLPEKAEDAGGRIS